MSRLAKKTIPVPQGVTLEEKEGKIIVKGPKATLELTHLPGIKVKVENSEIKVEGPTEEKQDAANLGTMWALIRNAVLGVTEGFTKKLELEGVGFKAVAEGKSIVLNLGFSHPIRFTPPESIVISVEKNTITVSGPDKNLVGKAAAEIRAMKKPEPYKGKGIHYQGEVIRRKVGKKAAAASA